jgi:hypothetical protein
MKYLILALLLVLAGCNFQNPVHTAQAVKDRSLTVEEAARKTVSCLPPHAGPDAFQVRDQTRYEASLLVLFTAICPAPDNPRMNYDIVGYALVEQHQGLWIILFSNWSGEVQQPPSQTLLIGQGGQAGQQILYGQSLHPNVARVEISFSSGKVQDLPIKNQVFHHFITDADQPCGLRALAADGRVLEQRNLRAAAC